MSPFASMSDQHSLSVSNAHTANTKKIIRATSQREIYMRRTQIEPEILSLPGSVFPPMRSAFFP